MKQLLAILLLAVPGFAFAAGAQVSLDSAPVNLHDKISLQRGAQIFVNHCLNCHSAQYMRYGRLTDLGLTELQIKEYLLFTSDKIGDPMATTLAAGDGED
jgi:ubiquinol-cytochrome c reductase cytochrome c1 subunit